MLCCVGGLRGGSARTSVADAPLPLPPLHPSTLCVHAPRLPPPQRRLWAAAEGSGHKLWTPLQRSHSHVQVREGGGQGLRKGWGQALVMRVWTGRRQRAWADGLGGALRRGSLRGRQENGQRAKKALLPPPQVPAASLFTTHSALHATVPPGHRCLRSTAAASQRLPPGEASLLLSSRPILASLVHASCSPPRPLQPTGAHAATRPRSSACRVRRPAPWCQPGCLECAPAIVQPRARGIRGKWRGCAALRSKPGLLRAPFSFLLFFLLFYTQN